MRKYLPWALLVATLSVVGVLAVAFLAFTFFAGDEVIGEDNVPTLENTATSGGALSRVDTMEPRVTGAGATTEMATGEAAVVPTTTPGLAASPTPSPRATSGPSAQGTSTLAASTPSSQPSPSATATGGVADRMTGTAPSGTGAPSSTQSAPTASATPSPTTPSPGATGAATASPSASPSTTATVGAGGESAPPGNVDEVSGFPILADATGLISAEGFASYDTNYSVDQAVAFYRQEMPPLGWELAGEERDGEAVSLTFLGEDSEVNVTIEPGMITLLAFSRST